MPRETPHERALRFVRTWKKAETVEAVAAEMGIKAQSAMQIASRLRLQGVQLKKMRRNPVDYEALRKEASGDDGSDSRG